MTYCPWTCQTLKGKPPVTQQIESEEQDSLAHIFTLKQDEPAPKTDPKSADLQSESEEQDSLAHIFALKQDEPAPKTDPKLADLVPKHTTST
jgi:hypothetical protein